jgi:hypothetical protein
MRPSRLVQSASDFHGGVEAMLSPTLAMWARPSIQGLEIMNLSQKKTVPQGIGSGWCIAQMQVL